MAEPLIHSFTTRQPAVDAVEGAAGEAPVAHEGVERSGESAGPVGRGPDHRQGAEAPHARTRSAERPLILRAIAPDGRIVDEIPIDGSWHEATCWAYLALELDGRRLRYLESHTSATGRTGALASAHERMGP